MKIFIIDDDESSNFLTRMMLVLQGAKQEITTFLSATDALEVLEKSNDTDIPDIILLDLDMPFFNGWDFLEALSALRLNYG